MATTPKILITGASGFIGANLLREALLGGCEVHAFLRKEAKDWRLSGIPKKFFSHEADITDRKGVYAAMQEIKPDYVFHLAAYGAYPAQKDQEVMVRANILGTMNLMDAALEYGSKAFINTGSSSEYGQKSEPMRESDLLEPDILYAVTKAAGTHYGAMQGKAKNAPIATLRLFSVYGPFEEPGRLMPSIMIALARKGRLRLGSPDNVRDFVYVKDVCRAYFLAAEAASGGKIPGEIINICSGTEAKVGGVVEAALRVSGAEVKPEWGESAPRPYEKKRWVGDGEKAKKLLGFRPEYNLEAGLRETYEWFRKYSDLYPS